MSRQDLRIVRAQRADETAARIIREAVEKVTAGHALTITEDPRLGNRGWPTAWVWSCSCGTQSHSAFRDRPAAEDSGAAHRRRPEDNHS